MATILERFNKLGLAYSRHVLSVVGQHVAIEYGHMRKKYHYIEGYYPKPEVKQQDEGLSTFFVNDYPEKYTEFIDYKILDFITKKQKPDYIAFLLSRIMRKPRQRYLQKRKRLGRKRLFTMTMR